MGRVPLKKGLLSTIDPEESPHLLAGRCAACDRHHFPPAPVCPYCSADDCPVVPLSRRGRLYLHTAVLKAPPGYRGRVPYGFGVIELPERIRIVSRLAECDSAKLEPGATMEVVLEELFVNEDGDTVVGWAFAPAVPREA